MEKYFRIPKEHRIYGMYVEFKDMSKRINEAFVEFAKENGIDTSEYYQTTESLYICPTEKDEEKFGKYFKKNIPGEFKKTSPLSKAWVKKCKELEIKTVRKPSLAWEFGIFGSSRQRIFMIHDVLYASLSTNRDFETLEGLEEIKASEFFKVIEDYEESLKVGDEK